MTMTSNNGSIGGWRLWAGLTLALAMGVGSAFAQEKRAETHAAPARASIYDKKADAKIAVDRARERAKKDNKRVLVMFGGDWCGWCHKLHELFASNPEIRRTLASEYELVMIDIESPNAQPILKASWAALGPDDPKNGGGVPFLAVLDAEGKILKAQPTGVLEEGDHHDPKRVMEFLTHWVVAPEDAHRLLEEALSRATSDDKRVFLTFGAPWCGWCHRLRDWLDQPEVAAILSRDFIVTRVDIDRSKGGKEVMSSYRGARSGGIPWYTILDTNGKSLATADGPQGNIGYPFKPEEIDLFVGLIKGQARHIDEPQLQTLRRSLVEACERIEKQSHR
jgi:thioredoxin-related protein